jgi:hypothetical protein
VERETWQARLRHERGGRGEERERERERGPVGEVESR